MPVLHLDEQQFPLPAAPIRIGGGADMDVMLPSEASLGLQAVIERAAGDALVIRRAVPSALVRVNGVVLGAEPTPLMHGDKVEIGGLELRFAEDAKAGETQFVSADALAAMVGARRHGGSRATAASGGRVISLVDGKEYLVPDAGVVFGRDASCDIVVGENDVSRRHAEIVTSDGGYVVRDVSVNGVFVNGERVQGSHRLMRADVVKIGTEEFRFYADVLAAVAPAGSATTDAPLAEVPAESIADAPTMPSPRQSAPVAVAPAETAPAPAVLEVRPVLAMLETMNEGPAKGTREPLRTALAHVGRGAHNDVRLVDESVSETHAKLQRRDDGWYLVDMESTNGSYVDGTRVHGEQRIDGAAELRFGGVKMRFVPAGVGDVGDVDARGTRVIAAAARSRPAAAPQATEPPASRRGVPAWVWILAVVVMLAAVAFYMFKGRA